MLLPLRFWAVAVAVPVLFQGESLHRAGLQAAAARRHALADALFEAAALRYRADLRVPALARLRVHQMIVRAEGASPAEHDAVVEAAGEIERRLAALDVIEDLDPPFAPVLARGLLARWRDRIPAMPHSRAA